ncbi:MAG: 50S ribosomal protein L11 methyltransferase [Chitinophagia bacterium]|nr:50S ribosomal protein L11 methyltransferase [Chitinophagia bacterium]
MNTIAITIVSVPEEQELLIAQLSEAGFDGFEQKDTELIAYIGESDYQSSDIELILNQLNLTYSESIINKTNWNEVWESNFQPIQLGNKLGVRANFHPPFEAVEREIIITPKMSFGTGHHATTSLVMEMMLTRMYQDKTLLDFGSGTGILAILAHQLGAIDILAVDNDEWCIENAMENCKINQASQIAIHLSDKPVPGRTFDNIVANINRHILLEHLPSLINQLKHGGELIISGILVTDEYEMTDFCNKLGLQVTERRDKNGWLAIAFTLPVEN